MSEAEVPAIEEPKSTSSGGGLAGALWAQMSDIKTPLAVGAGLLYLIVREVYIGFYSAIGLDPAEVGHGRADIVEAAVLGLGLWLLVAVAATTLLTAVTVARSKTSVPLVDKRVALAGLAWSLVVLPFTSLIAVFKSPGFVSDGWNVAVVCVTVGVFVCAVALSRSRRFRLGAAVAGVLLLLMLVLVSHRWGYYQAERAKNGKEVAPGYLGLINIRVDPVCLQSAGPQLLSPDFKQQPVGYLGTHGPYSLFLVPGDHARIIRAPTSAYTMVSTTTGC